MGNIFELPVKDTTSVAVMEMGVPLYYLMNVILGQASTVAVVIG